MRTPLFWQDKTKISKALTPLSALYGHFSARRLALPHSCKVTIPVICVGNIVAGGAGKTPVALALGALLKAQGKQVHYLSRGYKGKLQGPVQVDVEKHTAADVGDEPLLLARMLPAWVARNKAEGAQAAEKAGAEMIIMDDGFQNPSLHKDISLLVIDGAYGFGNRHIMPAGPLRETIPSAMKRATAVVLLGEDKHQIANEIPGHIPLLRAHMMPTGETMQLKSKRVIGFAGIAHPQKFYRTLHQAGAHVVKMVAYRDHHRFKPKDYAFLLARATELEALLVTTSKDYVRLDPQMREKVMVANVAVSFEDEPALLRVLSA